MRNKKNPMSQFLINREANGNHEMSLAKEMIIGVFFQSIRRDIGEDVLTRDEEVLLVLECMNSVFAATEDENAEVLSDYLGIKV
jgi:hypothetical protein